MTETRHPLGELEFDDIDVLTRESLTGQAWLRAVTATPEVLLPRAQDGS